MTDVLREVDRRRALGDVVLQVAIRILNLGLGLVVTILVVRTLGQAGYGQWTTLLAIYQILAYVASMGMESVAVRQAAAEPEAAGRWVGALLATRALLSLPVMAIGAVAVVLLSESHAMLVAGLILLLDFPIGVASSLQVVHQLRVRNAVPMVVMTVNSVVWGAAVVVIHARDGGLVAFAVALAGSAALAGAIQVVAALRTAEFQLSVSWDAVRRLLRTGTTVGVAAMLIIAYGSIDQVIVFQQAGAVAAGLYGAAYRILTTAHFIPVSLMTTLAPLVAASWPADRERMLRIVRLAAELLCIASLGGLAFSLVAAEPVLRLVFGAEFVDAAGALQVLAAAFAVMCIGYLSGNLLLVVGQTRRQVVAAVAGLVVNVAGNLALVPRYGYVAAAWMTLATELVVNGLSLYFVCRALGLRRPPLGRSPRVALAAALLAGALALLDAAGVPLGGLLGATLVLYPALLLAHRVVDPRDLRLLVPSAARNAARA